MTSAGPSSKTFALYIMFTSNCRHKNKNNTFHWKMFTTATMATSVQTFDKYVSRNGTGGPVERLGPKLEPLLNIICRYLIQQYCKHTPVFGYRIPSSKLASNAVVRFRTLTCVCATSQNFRSRTSRWLQRCIVGKKCVCMLWFLRIL